MNKIFRFSLKQPSRNRFSLALLETMLLSALVTSACKSSQDSARTVGGGENGALGETSLLGPQGGTFTADPAVTIGGAGCWAASRSGPDPYGEVYDGWSVRTGNYQEDVDLGFTKLIYHTGWPYDLTARGVLNTPSKWGPWRFLQDDEIVDKGSNAYELIQATGNRERISAPDATTPPQSDIGTHSVLDLTQKGSGLIRLVTADGIWQFKSMTYNHQSLSGAATAGACTVSVGICTDGTTPCAAAAQVKAGATNRCTAVSATRYMLDSVYDIRNALIQKYDRDTNGRLIAIKNNKGIVLTTIDWASNLPYAVRLQADATTTTRTRTIYLEWNYQGLPVLSKVRYPQADGYSFVTYTYDASTRLSTKTVTLPKATTPKSTTFIYSPPTTPADAPVSLLTSIQRSDSTLRTDFLFNIGTAPFPGTTFTKIVGISSYTASATVADHQSYFQLDNQCLTRGYRDAKRDITTYDRAAWMPYAITNAVAPDRAGTGGTCSINYTLRGGSNLKQASDLLQADSCYLSMSYGVDANSGLLVKEKGKLTETRLGYIIVGGTTTCGYDQTSNTYVACPLGAKLRISAAYTYLNSGSATQPISWTKYAYSTTPPHYELVSIQKDGQTPTTFGEWTYKDNAAPGTYTQIAVTSGMGAKAVYGFDDYGLKIKVLSGYYLNGSTYPTYSKYVLRNSDGDVTNFVDGQRTSGVLTYGGAARTLNRVTLGPIDLQITDSGQDTSLTKTVTNDVGTPTTPATVETETDDAGVVKSKVINGMEFMTAPSYTPTP